MADFKGKLIIKRDIKLNSGTIIAGSVVEKNTLSKDEIDFVQAQGIAEDSLDAPSFENKFKKDTKGE